MPELEHVNGNPSGLITNPHFPEVIKKAERRARGEVVNDGDKLDRDWTWMDLRDAKKS